MNRIRRSLAAAIAAILVVSCTDDATMPIGPEPIVTSRTYQGGGGSGGGACDLVSGMSVDVKSWFPKPERTDAEKVMKALAAACVNEDTKLRTQLSTTLLQGMEWIVDAGRGGDAAIGSRLANALLACTTDAGCTSTALPGIDLASALSASAGIFRVYTGDMDGPAVARGVMPFVDFDGRQNTALFGVELTGGWSWTAANGGTPLVLLYGAPVVDDPLTLLEPGFGALQYDVKRWPRNGPFVGDNIVHFAACFASEVALPHDHATGQSTQPRMQRENTLLTTYVPTFCPPTGGALQASLLGSVIAVTRSVLPARWLAMFSDIRTPVVGGSALDFSRFAPVAADVGGRIEMVSGPAEVVKAGTSIGPIVVRGLSGGGTPMERVRVNMYIEKNRGIPAGAVLIGNTSGYTNEIDGTVTIDGLTIRKPGGYTICVRGELDGFTFQEVCSAKFHIRK